MSVEQMYIDGLKELTTTFEVLIPDSEIIKRVQEILTPPQEGAQAPLEKYSYWKDDDINGNIFHIAENILKINLETCTIQEKAMAMKMSRINKNGKCASFVQQDYLKILGISKKELAELLLQLEAEFGKFHTKASLMKVKYDTTTIYDQEHMDKVVNFCSNFFEKKT